MVIKINQILRRFNLRLPNETLPSLLVVQKVVLSDYNMHTDS